ncbi:MAG TPA: helix-turn-helix transcriptional regulator [Tepidiformaceae bacterium]|nr:helix-turn-helix transcriptional regulator [Tepidiformaceae bacterium]
MPQASRKLSPRETEALALIAGGATNKQMALAMGIAERTVAGLVSSILVKLQAPNRAAAAAMYAASSRGEPRKN